MHLSLALLSIFRTSQCRQRAALGKYKEAALRPL